MTMNNENRLTAHDSLNPENISRADYTNTLAAEAFRVGLLTEEDIARMQVGLMQTLSEVVGYHSGGHSTSVQTDRAKVFGQSILFNVDTHLLTLDSPMTAVNLLKTGRISDLYAQGYAINKKRFEQAKVLYARVRYTRLRDGSAEYNKTLDVKLKNYFDKYDPRFTAHAKMYITLGEYGIRGAYTIDRLAGVLQNLIDVNTGKKADVVM